MAEVIDHLYSKFLSSNGVSIDTRTLQEGNLFFAISGPNFNANTFASQALQKGATWAVVDDAQFAINDRCILVEDGLKALQGLAKRHRNEFSIPILGITGSNGKTTTKELISNVLSKKYMVHATKGNYNNHIGVPLTLLQMQPDTEIAIVEMGANHVGEIASYCQVANPTHGLITNIGRAHTETFGGIEGVIRGKSELFDFLRKTEGIPIINMNDKVLSNMSKRFVNPIQYPAASLYLLETSPFLHIKLGDQTSGTHLVGKYNYNNIAAAVAIGQLFEVSNSDILAAIGEYDPDNARSQIIKKGTTTIILDAYNANPDSMRVALESLAEQSGKTMAILGDMNELENPDEAHLEILDYARELGIKLVLTLGEKIGSVSKGPHHFGDKEKLADFLGSMDLSESTVLLKASRSIKLETIVNSIH